MSTSSPVKKNIKINDLDTWNGQEWFNEKVVLNLSATPSLKHCYESYKNYLEVRKRVVPLTKKSLSGLFRDLVKENENQGKIRFYYFSSIFIKGIEIQDLEIKDV